MAFQIVLGFAVAALMAAAAFLPRRCLVLEDLPMRRLLTATPEDTKFALLDAQIEMVVETATLVKRKGRPRNGRHRLPGHTSRAGGRRYSSPQKVRPMPDKPTPEPPQKRPDPPPPPPYAPAGA